MTRAEHATALLAQVAHLERRQSISVVERNGMLYHLAALLTGVEWEQVASSPIMMDVYCDLLTVQGTERTG